MNLTARLIPVLAVTLALSSGAWAETKSKAPSKAASAASEASAPASGAGMGCGSMTPMDCEKRQAEMKKIHEAKDPAERQKLMEQHHKRMHDEHMGKGGMGMMGASSPMAASK